MTDVVVCALAFAALGGRDVALLPETLGAWRWVLLAAVACAAWPLSLRWLDIHRSQRLNSIRGVASRLALAAGITIASLGGTAIALGVNRLSAIVLLGVSQGLALASLRLACFAALRFARRHGRNTRNVLVVGTGPRADTLRRRIEAHPSWGLRILAYLDDTEVPVVPGIPGDRVRKLVELPTLIHEEVVDHVLVACPRSMLRALSPAVACCATAGVPLHVLTDAGTGRGAVRDLFCEHYPPPRVATFDAWTALGFAPVHHSPLQLTIKRGIDLVGAAVGLVLAAPVLVVASLAVKASSPGPVMFRQVRCGLHGRRFEMLKLRTMYVGSEQRLAELTHLNEMSGPVFKLRADPRITPVGRLLRRYSIDELPQFWNVLRGDMSVVGPRPPMPHEVARYETAELRRLSMRPGITCLWQVGGRNAVAFDDWVRLDLAYIDAWSLASDAKILARTVLAVAKGTGA
jgi:exopolysaccharide biosynthesis polyprenyl glycosylphosphotransferase